MNSDFTSVAPVPVTVKSEATPRVMSSPEAGTMVMFLPLTCIDCEIVAERRTVIVSPSAAAATASSREE